MKRHRIIPLISLVLPLLSACSIDNLAGGSGSTTTNGMVVGRIAIEAGSGASRTAVGLFRSDYDPVKDTADVYKDTTDSLGNFSFPHVPPDSYSIVAAHLDTKKRTIVTGLRVAEDTVTAPTGTLQAPGRLSVALPAGIDSTAGYVYIPGTSCFAFLNDHTDSVELDSVPWGMLPAVVYSSTNGSASTVIRYDVAIAPGKTSVVRNPAWAHSKALVLNTTPAGADIAGPVENFPVLIRLTSSNIDFSRAKSGGADIRFTKSDNTFLPYEIERWDPVTELAEVWVNVDTVYGNSSGQTLVMYWGNAEAASGSSGTGVFDTATGFAGVWHLGQSAVAVVADATANGIHGTPKAIATAEGVVGRAQSFNGTSSFIRADGSAGEKLNFPESGHFSVSAWVNADALDSAYHGIVYKSNFQYGLQIRPENNWEFFTFIDKTGWEESKITALASSWHFLTGVRRGNQQYLYIDGVCVDSSKAVVTSNLSRVYDSPLEIGHCPDGGMEPDRYFSGMIDEVRISSVANSPDWIKLCYMNQKEEDALVKW